MASVELGGRSMPQDSQFGLICNILAPGYQLIMTYHPSCTHISINTTHEAA